MGSSFNLTETTVHQFFRLSRGNLYRFTGWFALEVSMNPQSPTTLLSHPG